MVFVTSRELAAFVRSVLIAVGAPAEAAAEVAAHLVRADASGHASHGVRCLAGYVRQVRAGDIDPAAAVEVVADHGSIVVLDGCHGFGQVTGRTGVTIGEERAREHGIACVAARNAGHLGRLGEYSEGLAANGVAAIMLVNAQGGGPCIAAHGGREKRLANNPISLGFPGDPHAAVVDMALSPAAGRRIQHHGERGVPLPEGWITDADGNPSTDPSDYSEREGLMLPLGGPAAAHKGYGLLVLVDLLVGVLSGGGVPGGISTSPPENAYLLIAIDVGRFVPGDRAQADFAAFRDYLLSSTPLPDAEVLFPGDRSTAARARADAEGVRLDPTTWAALHALSAELGIAMPER